MKKILISILTILWVWLSFCSSDYSIYHNSDLWLISVYDWTTWFTLQDKNLWASNLNDYWHYYQWWNNFWFDVGSNTNSTKYDFSNYYWDNYYSFMSYCNDSSAWCFYQNNNTSWNGYFKQMEYKK